MAIPLGLSLGLSVVARPLVSAVGRHYSFIARPKDSRLHRTPTAVFGGIGVLVASGRGALASLRVGWPSSGIPARSVTMVAVGLVDGATALRPRSKLTAQAIAASLASAGGARFVWTGSLAADSFFTVLWLRRLSKGFHRIPRAAANSVGIARSLVTGRRSIER